MDCSSAAASNHLVAATDALRPLAAGRLGEFADAVASRVARLVPPETELAVEVDRAFGPAMPTADRAAIVRWMAVGAVLAVAAWFAWRAWQVIVL